MSKLSIRNFGPIKSATIEIKKYNIIIGPQSSGKSCILKVASFCKWMEKRIELTQEPNELLTSDIMELQLIQFHKLEGYLQENTLIKYDTPFMVFSISFAGNDYSFDFKWKERNRWNYLRPKIAYIPAERNIVAAIPNWFDVRLSENNIKNYMSDWDDARSFFDQQQPLPILNLGVKYYYSKDKNEDWINIGKNKTIRFTNASSGLQSITPMLALLRYFTFHIINIPNRSSRTRDKETAHLRSIFADKILGIPTQANNSAWIVRTEDSKKYDDTIVRYEQTQYTSIYLEEPEENLFPSTQYEFVKWMAQQINQNHYHDIFITTHSPYILSSLNNLIQAYDSLVSNKENAPAIKKVLGSDSTIPFDDISVFAINNGRIKDIKDKELRLISQTELDSVSNTISTDFSNLHFVVYL